jgi:ABC-type uncharacterized transport system ATPase subunit
MPESTATHLPDLDTSQAENAIIRMDSITKRFPGVVANDEVHLHVRPGAFHAVIGENGAGKSTLLNILYGRYQADAGRIFVRGEEVTRALHSPADAIRRGVGLVSQHYALIPALSVLENVMLGAEPTLPGGVLARRRALEKIAALTDPLGLAGLDLNARAERLSVAAQQKVEILKALYRGATILLLDEPTATLAPQEAEALFALLHTLVSEGATLVFVTHKLREVMQHSDSVTVLRAGRNVGDFVTSQTEEQDLLLRMIGARHVGSRLLEEQNASRPAPSSATGSPLLQVESVTVRNARRAEAVRNVSLELRSGEVVGIAGVDGSGQRELSEALVGLRRIESGRIFLAGVELTHATVRERQRRGMAYIPEDRHRVGMVLDFSIAENYLLGHERRPEWGGGRLLDAQTQLGRAADMIRRYDVRVGERDATSAGRNLSGGNQQKIIIARAMDSDPRVLIACQPTRGLDVEAARFVYKTLRDARDRGLGVLLFSLDLDEVLELSDRIAVMFNGRIQGILARDQATPESVGALMTGAGEGRGKSEEGREESGSSRQKHVLSEANGAEGTESGEQKVEGEDGSSATPG